MMKKKWLLSLLAAAACFVGAFGLTACGEEETGHEHKWSDWSVAEMPTSAEAGKATRTCSGSGNCDATETDKEFSLPDLTSADYTVTGDTATCEAAGTATYAYNKSGVTVSFTAATNAKGHAYGTTYTYEDETGHWQVCANNSAHTTTKEAHDEKGTDGACSKCGYTAPAPKHEHDWNDWTISDDNKPTAEKTGKATRTCNNEDCDAEAGDKEYTLPVLTSEDYTKSKDTATCIAAGKVTYTYNKGGVNVSFDVETPVNADAHAYGNTYVNTDPEGHYQVCTNNEEHTSTKAAHNTAGTNGACTVCGYSETGHTHTWDGWTVTNENKPTAEKTGKATRTCNNADCDAEASDKEYELPVLTSEDYTKSEDIATCTAAGKITYTYNKDGVNVSFDVETPVKEHTEEVIAAKAATCTETGLTEGKKCSVCEEILVAQETVEAKGHTEQVIAAKAATCTEDGLTEGKKCSVCEIILVAQNTIAAGHTEEVLVAKAATCTEDGLTEGKKCSVCGEILVAQNTIAAGHTEQILTNKYPTCTETGLTEGKKCSVCGEILVAQEPIAALGHIEGVLEGVEATCSEDGLTEGKKCSVCQTVLEEQKVIAAKGHSFSTAAPTVDETGKTVSTRCTECNKTVVYEYDNAVNATSTAIGSPDILSDGVSYVIQSGIRNYLSYTFEEAGTYTIYWVNLNSDKLSLTCATFGSTTAAFIKSGSAQNAYMVNGCIFEGYNKGSEYKYYEIDEEGNAVLDDAGNKVQGSVQPGDYAKIKLVKNNILTAGLSGFSIVKLTFEAAANSTIKLNINDANARYLIGIDKEPTVAAEVCTVGAGDYAIKDTDIEFMSITEDTAGTYTFTAAIGKFELYVNGDLYSDGEKAYFGYVNFCERYLTVDLQEGDVVKVVKVSKRASEKNFTIHEGTVEEPALPEYRTLQLGDQTISLSDTNIAVGKYEDSTEQFYSFTAPESGYYEISVAEGVNVSAVIRADKTHYTFLFDVVNMKKHSGVFNAEEGEIVIIAFVGNDTQEFSVNIAACEEPITYLEVNEKLENISFAGVETFVKITVGDSVAEGTYLLTFKVSNNLLRAYIYFSIGEEIVVEDRYDTNAVAAYVNSDIADGANHTVGAGTRDNNDEDYSRTITVKAGDVIYLATTAITPGCVDITLTPVEE